MLFSIQADDDSGIYGFDAGLYQLLARYIFGDSSKISIVHVTSPLVSDRTREGVLLDDRADAVFSTYSILPEREEIISFAGPYFVTRQSVLVGAGNTQISGYEDLAGKKVAVQYGTSVIPVMKEYAPEAILVELNGDDECLEALANGKVDAYVSDFTILASANIEHPGVFEIRGEPFGPNEATASACRRIPTALRSSTGSCAPSKKTAPGQSCGRSASATASAGSRRSRSRLSFRNKRHPIRRSDHGAQDPAES